MSATYHIGVTAAHQDSLPSAPRAISRWAGIAYHAVMSDAREPEATDTPEPIDPELLEILRCPLTRSRLRREDDDLVAEQPEGAGLRYPIREGIPILLIEEATLPEGVASLEQFKERYAEHIASHL